MIDMPMAAESAAAPKSELKRVAVVSDGTPAGTRVLCDGKQLDGVMSVVFVASRRDGVVCTITLRPGVLDLRNVPAQVDPGDRAPTINVENFLKP